MKQKILLSAKNMKIGGIEKSLVNLANYLCENNYDVTVILEEKKGELLKDLNKKISIIKFTPSKKKLVNFLKKILFIFKYRNKFDTSISFATYLKSGSFVARTASENSVLWCHANYLDLYKGKKSKVENFFENLKYEYFNKIVFVSKKAMNAFLEVFPNQKNVYYCNNLVDYNNIYKKAEENISIDLEPNMVTFLNVGIHDEKQKKLSRIIEASKKLAQKGYEFRVIFVGSGPDTEKYKKMVENYGLENYIIFAGKQLNPYPYYKISNCVIISSDYEGYPLTFLESYVLNKPIITTNITDCEEIRNGRGIVTTKNVDGIYKSMERFIKYGYYIEKPFNVRKYNKEVKKTLQKILKIS